MRSSFSNLCILFVTDSKVQHALELDQYCSFRQEDDAIASCKKFGGKTRIEQRDNLPKAADDNNIFK